MTAPLVSCVLLTTHPRRAAFLPDALRSYRQQTYAARELVIVNDGAPLAPRARDVRVVNLQERPRGRWTIGEKRNAGVLVARGEYVATWDDDDVSLPERLANQVAVARATGADHVTADRMHVADEDLRVQGQCDRGRARPVQSSALIRRAAILAAGGYAAADYREDAELLARLRLVTRGFNHAVTMTGCDWYVNRRHGENVTSDFGERGADYIACALRDPAREAVQRRVDALRAGPGAEDLIEKP